MKFKKENIPNILTIIRILLFPIVVFFIFFKIDGPSIHFNVSNYLIYIPTNMLIAGILFVIASITDALDGYLARKNNWISTFGKIWDPIADKVLVNSILISFSVLGLVPFYITIIMICRDTIVDAYRLMAVKNNTEVAANILGKLKTIFQMIAIIIIFFIFQNEKQSKIPGINEYWEYYILQNGLMFIALFFSVYSGINYILQYGKKQKNNAI